jgi:rhomboid family protein
MVSLLPFIDAYSRIKPERLPVKSSQASGPSGDSEVSGSRGRRRGDAGANRRDARVRGAPGASIPNVGASGAIAGVLGAYFVLLPRASVLTAFILFFVFLREIPAVWFLNVWFVFGVLTVRLMTRRPPLQPAW